MSRKLIVISILLFTFFSTMFASDLKEAASEYEKGNYSNAIEIYNSVLKEKGTSSQLLYNLGNAYYKAGDLGQAMLCYRRSLLLSPSNKSARENILYLTQKIEDNNKAEAKGKKVSVSADDRPFFSALKQRISFSFSQNTWAIWSVSSFIIAIICAALYIFSSKVLIRKIGFFGGLFTLGIAIVTLIFALVSASARENISQGVVTGYKVNLLSAPSSDAKSQGNPLTRGTVMDVLEIKEVKEMESQDAERKPGCNKWYKVRLNSDYSGWINNSEFEVI